MRRRYLLVFGAVLIATLAAPQTKLQVIVSGRLTGEASFSQKIMPDGSKLVQLTFELRAPDGRTVHVRSESLYDSKGASIRKFLESASDKPRLRRQIVATFDSEGANVVEEISGKRKTQKVALVKAAPRENMSEFWFIRDKPKPGDSVKFYRFDMDGLSWMLSTIKYVGQKYVKLGKGTVLAHQVVQDDEVTAYLDNAGLPIVLEKPGVRFERIEKAAAQVSGLETKWRGNLPRHYILRTQS
jgi:hypothetical protein